MASASASNTSHASVTPILSLPNTTHFIKLESCADYLNWVTQFQPVLKAHELVGIVDGSEPCPPKFLVDESGKTTDVVDPKYSLWEKRDQVFLSLINNTLLGSVLSSVYGLNTSQQVWNSLTARFASQSPSKISYLKRQLQTLQ